MRKSSRALFQTKASRIRLLLLVCIIATSGCANLVAYQLDSAKSYPFSKNAKQNISQEFGIETRRQCLDKAPCINYLFGPARLDSRKLSMNLSAQFTDEEYSSSLDLARDKASTYRGAIFLIHGFRGSKEWMMTNMAYFQYLGFDTYALDLLGHGDSPEEKGFGPYDALELAQLIETKRKKGQVKASYPIYAVGYSMGGFVAASLLDSGAIDAAILQAPMTRFDESLLGYIKDNPPWYGLLFNEQNIQEGAIKALDERGLSPEQTNIMTVLSALDKPTLLFASDIDSVSPYSVFYELKQSEKLSSVSLVELKGREHAYMSIIGQQEHEYIQAWLESVHGEKQ